MPPAGPGPRLIVALDRPDAAGALALADRLDPAACRVKVGLELYTAAGPAVIEALHGRGFAVFLDLKFHDIPNTVAGACTSAARLGVWMLNVHAGGGPAMLGAATRALAASGSGALLVGVTVLTSLDDDALVALGIAEPAPAHVLRLAALSRQTGLAGVVCSAREAAAVRAHCGPDFVLVTPGIRSAGEPPDDQRRTASAREALAAGADYLVVGRPVTAAPDPAGALARFVREMADAESG